MNSLQIEHQVNNLFADADDGLIFLDTLDKIKPGCIPQKQVDKKPKRVFNKVANCNLVVDTCKSRDFNMHMVNIGGNDIVECNKKLILGMTWQMMRFHLLDFLKSAGGGKALTEADMISWANGKVDSVGFKGEKISKMGDSSLKNGLYFMHLLKAIEPDAINWDIVTPGSNDAECEQNAKYVLSVARKIGCLVFLLWEDIVEVKPKMLTTLMGSLM